jgi:hypothetical protein
MTKEQLARQPMMKMQLARQPMMKVQQQDKTSLQNLNEEFSPDKEMANQVPKRIHGCVGNPGE